MITPAAVQRRLNKIDQLLCSAQSELETLKDEMQETFDERSERWQEGENGQAWQEKVEELDEAYGNLEELVSTVQGQME